jgi:hypothetical protein
VKSAFKLAIDGTPITMADSAAGASVQLDVLKANGAQNQILFAATNPEGASLDCYFVQQLAAVSPLQFDANTPLQQGSAFSAGIMITTNGVLTDEQVGKALAHALVVYAR